MPARCTGSSPGWSRHRTAVCAVLLAPVVEAKVRALRERDSPGLRRYTEATGL